MCLIVLAYKYHPDYKLILAANRDEFYERPSEAAKFWKDKPSMLAGKDLKEGGTWCGITKDGRLAAITNYRNIKSIKNDAVSRGKIVTDYLTGSYSPEQFAEILTNSAEQYNGYSLVLGDESTNLFFFSNQTKKLEKIQPGIHGLSNHLLDTPWFNVTRGKEHLKNAINKNENFVNNIFEVLSDKTPAPDDNLPDTGLPKEIEKSISSIFVENKNYGTRSSTIILIDNEDNVTFIEKSLEAKKKKWITKSFSFEMVQDTIILNSELLKK
jgi:uncharacterized protein with NRDE domain